VATSKKGIYVCGAFAGPKDIPQSVIEASSAAAEAGALLSGARNTLTKTKDTPEELNILGEPPRIGTVCASALGGNDMRASTDLGAPGGDEPQQLTAFRGPPSRAGSVPKRYPPHAM
jgi:hypothetical protein